MDSKKKKKLNHKHFGPIKIKNKTANTKYSMEPKNNLEAKEQFEPK